MEDVQNVPVACVTSTPSLGCGFTLEGILAAQRVCLNHFSQPPGRHPAAHRRQSVAVVVKRALDGKGFRMSSRRKSSGLRPESLGQSSLACRLKRNLGLENKQGISWPSSEAANWSYASLWLQNGGKAMTSLWHLSYLLLQRPKPITLNP